MIAVITKAPGWYELYIKQGQILPGGQATLLSEQPILLSENRKRLIIFWATWCGPCSIELSRINRMIINGELKPEAVLAISSGENRPLVQNVVADRKYLFPVAVDEAGLLAQTYKISGTPTLFFVSEKNIIEWTAMGISPTLEFRIKNFFN